MRKFVIVGVVILLVAAIFAAWKFAQPKSSQEITIGYAALRSSLPVFVAQDKGFFAQEGLQVKLERFDTAQPLMQSLIAGTIQAGGYTAMPITYTAMLRGKIDLYFATAMLENTDHRVNYLIIPKDSPASFSYADLRGKKIGILPTVAYKVWLEAILKSKGVDAKFVKIVQIDPALQATALQSKQVDALYTNDPAATTALQKGIGRLISGEVELPEVFGDPFLFNSFNIRKDFADKNPDMARKIVRALDKAAGYVNAHPAESKQTLKNYLNENQKPFVEFYPDALYQSSAETDPQAFQHLADTYRQIGIIDGDLSIAHLVITHGSLPR